MSLDPLVSRSPAAAPSLSRAQLALQAGLHDTAMAHLHAVLEDDPDNPAARLLQARLCLAQNQPQLALAALHHFDVDHPQATHLRAEAVLRLKDADPAALPLDQLTRQSPDDVQTHALVAALLLQRGQSDKAAAALRRLLQLQPAHAAAAEVLAEVLEKTNPQAAIDVLLAAAAAGEHDHLRHRAAQLYRRNDQLADAHGLYTELLERLGPVAALLTEHAELADSLGDQRLAIDRITQALAAADHAPDHLAAHHMAAIIFMHVGRFPTAGYHWFRVLREVPYHAQAWAGLLICAHHAQRPHLRRRAHTQLKLHACPDERRRHLAELWRHADRGRAVAWAIDASDHPTTPPPRSPLRRLLARADAVLSVLRHTTAHQADLHHADLHYHHAVCQQALGRTADARRAVDQALAVNPRYAAANRLADDLAA